MRLKNFLWLLFLAALWGPSFLFIKVAVADIPPLTLVVGRVGIAGISLYLILRTQGRNLMPWGQVWAHLAVVALVQNALPFVLFSWGEQYIDSGLAAILNGTTPLFTLMLAHFFTHDDRLTPTKAFGTVIGFGGLLFLIGPSLLAGVRATAWGLLAVTIASASYGVAIIYSRRHLRGLPPLVGPATQLLLATLFMIPLALLFERPFELPAPSWPALGSLLALSVFGTALAFVVYYYLIERVSATYVSMVTYLVPIFGVILGVLILNEQLGWNAYLGCALILLGVMIVNGVLRVVSWQRPTDVAVRP
ncbi:MAG TPA: EamA family transporter [Anaerolineae bacterium]|nr:EamA family transporter [Anaerolineae bacterium]HXW01300.1 EamA family transporter [Anaerolineae bacterium]